MSTRFLTEADKTYLLQLFDNYTKEVNDTLLELSNKLYSKEEIDRQLKQLSNKSYSKEEIDNMFGSYVEDIAALIGGI